MKQSGKSKTQVKPLTAKGANSMDLEMTRPVGMGDGVMEIIKDQQAQEEEQARADAKMIESIDDDFGLFSWGWSSPLKRSRSETDRKGNLATKVEYFRLKIKSVGLSEIMEEWQSKAPVAPAKQQVHKRNSDVARQLGAKHDVMVWEINEADPAFRKEQNKFNNEFGKAMLLHSLAYDLKDNSGRLVLKGASLSEPNEVIDAEAALTIIFKKWGITSEHFAAITGDVRKLTEAKEVQEEGE